ncbi:MAG: DUF6438 domain-containing protein [Vicingaceae bacterium]
MRSLIAIFLLLTVACSSSKKSTEGQIVETPPEASAPADSLFMTFERTLCYGECPAFKVTVYADGRAVYEGKRFVEKLGIYDAELSKADIKAIQDEAQAIGYFTMEDRYDASVTDVPSVLIMISGPNGRKSVEDRFNAPDVLHNFEKYLDKILMGLDWKYRE